MSEDKKIPATLDRPFGYPRPAPKPEGGKKKGKKSKESNI